MGEERAGDEGPRPDPAPTDWVVIRCPGCRKLLGEVTPGSGLRRRCPRCGQEVTIQLPGVSRKT